MRFKGNAVFWIWLIQFLLTNTGFFLQGGFGAGHGPLDGIVAVFGLPGLLAVVKLDPDMSLTRMLIGVFFLGYSLRDWVSIVIFPAAVNALFYFAVHRIWRWKKASWTRK